MEKHDMEQHGKHQWHDVHNNMMSFETVYFYIARRKRDYVREKEKIR